MNGDAQRYTKKDREYYARWIDAGHVLRLDERGNVDYFGHECDGHNGPICIECEDQWCEHCVHASREKIEKCEGREPRLARAAEWAKKRRLQEAAPDMLKALVRLVTLDLKRDQPQMWRDAMSQARKAVRKAVQRV
jgi:hypothetical protein